MQLVVGGLQGLAEGQAAVVAGGLPYAVLAVENLCRGWSWLWIHGAACCSSAGGGMVPVRIGPAGILQILSITMLSIRKICTEAQ